MGRWITTASGDRRQTHARFAYKGAHHPVSIGKKNEKLKVKKIQAKMVKKKKKGGGKQQQRPGNGSSSRLVAAAVAVAVAAAVAYFSSQQPG